MQIANIKFLFSWFHGCKYIEKMFDDQINYNASWCFIYNTNEKKDLTKKQSTGNIFNCRQVKSQATERWKKVLDKGQRHLIKYKSCLLTQTELVLWKLNKVSLKCAGVRTQTKSEVNSQAINFETKILKKSNEQSFKLKLKNESLILAQDERWRRA